jgi:hypothetical protein
VSWPDLWRSVDKLQFESPRIGGIQASDLSGMVLSGLSGEEGDVWLVEGPVTVSDRAIRPPRELSPVVMT